MSHYIISPNCSSDVSDAVIQYFIQGTQVKRDPSKLHPFDYLDRPSSSLLDSHTRTVIMRWTLVHKFKHVVISFIEKPKPRDTSQFFR